VNMLQSIEWVFDELGRLVSQPGGPLLQPTINLMGQLIRPDQTQLRPNQDLDQHRQQLNISSPTSAAMPSRSPRR
jgi:hypothetical protein